jgi:hypothetical protein
VKEEIKQRKRPRRREIRIQPAGAEDQRNNERGSSGVQERKERKKKKGKEKEKKENKRKERSKMTLGVVNKKMGLRRKRSQSKKMGC